MLGDPCSDNFVELIQTPGHSNIQVLFVASSDKAKYNRNVNVSCLYDICMNVKVMCTWQLTVALPASPPCSAFSRSEV